MISFVHGKLFSKTPTVAIVEIGGIGLEISIPMSTSKSLTKVGETVQLLTHLYVKEDALKLFGFATEEERELFQYLISVSGVGPKLALTILSGVSIAQLYTMIATGNESALTAISGVGKKTAQRLIVDLKDKITSQSLGKALGQAVDLRIPRDVVEEAILALVSLGYNRPNAQVAVEKAAANSTESVTVEELITTALRNT